MIAEGTIQQFSTVAHLFGECVLVSPHRAVFTAAAPSEVFSEYITEIPELNTLRLLYRKSGLHAGAPFAEPQMLSSHIYAARQNRIANRLPAADAALRRSQVSIEILGIDGPNNEHLPGIIVGRIGQVVGVIFREIDEDTQDLDGGIGRS